MKKLKMMMLLLMMISMHMPCGVTSFDITKLLSPYPAYTTFSKYLRETELGSAINAGTLQGVTVLAVDNTGMGPLQGKSMDQIKKILSVHVALRYLDLQVPNQRTITLTTLLDYHLLKISRKGAVTFVSAAHPNGVIRAKLIKPIVTNNINISVVQVNSLIIPPTPNALISPFPIPPNIPSPMPILVPVTGPVPVVSPVPVTVPVPVVSPVPITAPVPIVSPIPVTIPVPIISPVPVTVPVPVVSPVPITVPVPIVSPIPVTIPVPVISPVPVTVPVPVVSPVPVLPPVPLVTPNPVMSPEAGGGSNPVPADETKSGVVQFGVNWSLAIILLTFSSIYH